MSRKFRFEFRSALDLLMTKGDQPVEWHLCGDQWIDGEEWRSVVFAELDGYGISSLGRVRGLEGQILRTYQHQGGYRRIRLGGNEGRAHLVHSLVATSFVGPRPDGWHINHKNGIQYNNTPDNLEYVTPGDNTRHANAVLGVYRPRGSRVNTAKLTDELAVEARDLYAAGRTSQRELARRYGVRQQTIQRLVTGQSWRRAANDLACPPVIRRPSTKNVA